MALAYDCAHLPLGRSWEERQDSHDHTQRRSERQPHLFNELKCWYPLGTTHCSTVLGVVTLDFKRPPGDAPAVDGHSPCHDRQERGQVGGEHEEHRVTDVAERGRFVHEEQRDNREEREEGEDDRWIVSRLTLLPIISVRQVQAGKGFAGKGFASHGMLRMVMLVALLTNWPEYHSPGKGHIHLGSVSA
jgi:hypothetical protein